MSTFTESAHPRAADGRFASKGPAAEETSVVLSMPNRSRELIAAHAQRYSSAETSFDQCWPAACDLAGEIAAADPDADVEVFQVVGDRGLASGGDPRWDEVAHSSRSHYLVRVGDEVIDLTARQFDAQADSPLVYPAGEVEQRWSDSYEIEARVWQREFRERQFAAEAEQRRLARAARRAQRKLAG